MNNDEVNVFKKLRDQINIGIKPQVEEHDSFLELQKFCTDLMSKEPEKIFKSLDFVSIPEKSLVSLLQNDSLLMSEVQLWEHVLKWGLAQNPELSSDPSNYSKVDFNTLKDTLQQCIPFIRFHNFTSKEFLNKVYLDSKMISNKHVELISRWIDKTETSEKSYEFKLLLRGSRDGFTNKQFHEICDGKSHTVSIIKVKDSNEILGGYNPIEWRSETSNWFNRYSITKNGFIYSFNDKENIDNHILSRVNNERCAINNWIVYGPSFGSTDLITFGFGGSYCEKENYEKHIRETDDRFHVEEYEVFQILRT